MSKIDLSLIVLECPLCGFESAAPHYEEWRIVPGDLLCEGCADLCRIACSHDNGDATNAKARIVLERMALQDHKDNGGFGHMSLDQRRIVADHWIALWFDANN